MKRTISSSSFSPYFSMQNLQLEPVSNTGCFPYVQTTSHTTLRSDEIDSSQPSYVNEIKPHITDEDIDAIDQVVANFKDFETIKKENTASHIQTFHFDTTCRVSTQKKRLHRCSYCDKSFKHSGHLGRHVSCSHFRKRRYKCQTCDKSFFQASHLQAHIKNIHKTNKPLHFHQ